MKKFSIATGIIILILTTIQLAAQNKVLLVNGGQYGNPDENPNALVIDPETGNYSVIDTLASPSVQDVLVEENTAYIAAQDSIYKYAVENGEQLAAVSFGSISTVSLKIYGDYLLVGNWYGSTDNNLRVFQKDDLSFVKSIEGVTKGAKDMVIAGDSAFVTQNYTSTSWTDSAGYFAVVDLKDLEFTRNIYIDNDDEDLGRLTIYNNMITALNPYSNTITTYNINSGEAETNSFPYSVDVNDYGSQMVREGNMLYFAFNSGLGSFNLETQEVVNEQIIDTMITAFTMDTVAGRFFVTQTDYASYRRGLVYSQDGSFIKEFPVGYSPEVLTLLYEEELFTFDDIEFWIGEGSKKACFVIDWNDNLDPVSLAWGYRWDGEANAEAMMQAINETDPYLQIAMGGGFLNDILYDLHQDGSWSHSGIGGDPDYWSTWSKGPSSEWEMNTGLGTSLNNGAWFGCSYGFEPEATPPDHPEAAPNTLTGLDESNDQLLIDINTLSDQISVKSHKTTVKSWRIVNLSGKTTLKQDSLADKALQIGIQGLPSGVYLLKLETGEGNFSHKFYKN
ncbi:MAG: T9SS type A sorting domain-containing protein [Bacteroidales bacterium]|nr:T9SS type A sorting domain-containing protein [Bacteroidales bacterium]